jgi:hypothetical protein
LNVETALLVLFLHNLGKAASTLDEAIAVIAYTWFRPEHLVPEALRQELGLTLLVVPFVNVQQLGELLSVNVDFLHRCVQRLLLVVLLVGQVLLLLKFLGAHRPELTVVAHDKVPHLLPVLEELGHLLFKLAEELVVHGLLLRR